MSSKIYSRDDPGSAEPLVWPQVGSTPGTAGVASTDAQARQAEGQRQQEIQREIERRVQEARLAGFQEGSTSAKAAAAGELKTMQQNMAESIAAIVELRPRLRRQAEADLVKLSLAIARRVLHRELAVDPEAMGGLIQAALARIQSQEICRVRIHPSQEAVVRSMLEHTPNGRSAQFQSDPGLARGTFIVETARGNLDASVETQLREIEQGLIDRLERA